MCKGLLMALMLSANLCAFAQEAKSEMSLNKEVFHSTTFGVGRSTILDTYLSPLFYEGTDLRLQRETMRMTNLWGGRVHNQTLLDINADINENPAGNLDEYAGGIRYSQGWFYNFREDGNVINPLAHSSHHWNYAAGLQASGYLGGVYIDRSGNNPGQAKADITIDASAMLTGDIRIGRHHYILRYQMSIPLIGLAFSPNYGQSYYEIFELNNYDHNVVCAWVGNMPSSRHRLTVDIPLRRADLRIGCVLNTSQARLNGLRYNNTSCDFMIGFNKYFYRK